MTIILGMDNSQAGPMLQANGQAFQLISPGSPTVDAVNGVVTRGAPSSVTVYGYPLPATSQFAKNYGFDNVQETDILLLLEAIQEPAPSMQLSCNGDVFQIIKVQAISKSGIALLFLAQVRK